MEKTTIALFCSLMVNMVGMFMYRSNVCQVQSSELSTRSPYAGLNEIRSIPWTHLQSNSIPTEYLGVTSLSNRTEIDPLSFDYVDRGAIALDRSYARSKGLPPGHVFPWDTSKEVYVLNGFHSLHCLATLREILWAVRSSKLGEHGGQLDSVTPEHLEHGIHCISSMKQDVLCAADDTPRYGGFDLGHSGEGQLRKCRDWSALDRWAVENSACFRFEHSKRFFGPNQVSLSEEEKWQNDGLWHYSWCPAGSPYHERAKIARLAVFGTDDDDDDDDV